MTSPPPDSEEPNELQSHQEVVRMLEVYLQQLEQGAPPRPEEWLARHAGLSGPLEEYLATLDLLHQTALNLQSVSSPEAVPALQGPTLGQLGDYRLVREVSRGGMGIVYEAEQLSLHRRVALKVLPLAGALDPRQLQRFHFEALTASQLHHPHIVDVFGAGCERGVHYYAMRYIEGQTLAQLIAQVRRGESESPPPPAPETDPLGRLTTEGASGNPGYVRAVAGIGAQVAEALDYAHEHGVVHRDIKPSNVLLDTEGQAWVADFGLARLRQQVHLTQSGDLPGTLRYMSPEQALAKRGILDHRTDVYSLGATLYELLTLQPAVPGTDRQEVLRQIAFEEPTRPALLNRAIPPDLEAIVLRAMAKLPEERYASASELAEDLRRFLNDQPVQARLPTRLQQAAKWARRHRRPLLAAGAVAVMVLSLAVFLLALSNVHIAQALAARDQALSDLRAQEQKTRAAERAQTLQLALSRWNEARIYRQTRQPGQRYRGLEALAEAVRHFRSLDSLESYKIELRNDAIACLSRWDVRPVKRWPMPGPPLCHCSFDSLCSEYVSCAAPDTITWRRVEDNQVLRHWRREATPCAGLFVSPDDRFLVALSGENTPREKMICRLWDSATGRLVLERTVGPRWGHAFGPGGKVLALARADGSIAFHDLGAGRDLPPLPAGPTIVGLCFHPRGRYLAVSFATQPGVQVWDLADGQVVASLLGRRGLGGSLAWNPDGDLLAVGSRDTNIYVCEFPEGDCRAILRGHEHVVTGVEFHPSGRLLASTSHDGTTRLWGFADGAEVVMAGETLLRFSRDGRRLATHCYQGVTLWELADPGPCLKHLTHGEDTGPGLWGVSFAPDGRLLASASQGGALLWDAASARLVGQLPSGDGGALAFPPNAGRPRLVTSGPGGLRQWPIRTDRTGRVLPVGPGTVLRRTTAASESLRFQVASRGQWLILASGRRDVDLVPLAEGASARHLGRHDGVDWVALSPDARWAVSAGGEKAGAVRVWDVARGALVRQLPHEGGYYTPVFSPDGRWLVTSTRREFRFWQTGSWQRKGQLPRHPRSLYGFAAFSRDGRLLALAHGHNFIDLHDAVSLKHLARLETPGLKILTGLGLSPDGGRLAAATTGNVLGLWDLRRLRGELAVLGLDW
jgi:serine/threonine protein kinase/WD40 repeat protein